MHIKISKSSLSEALNSVQTVVGGKSTIPVLMNVKMSARDGKVEFTCSDLDITLIAHAECTVLEEGETTIPVKTFASAVSKVVDGEIDIDVDPSDKACLSAGTTIFKFNGIAAKEFPTTQMGDGKSVVIQAPVIREMLRKTNFAMSADETRAALNSVLLDFMQEDGKVKAVATDGRRLALLDCELDGVKDLRGQFVLPRKAVDILLKKLPKDGECTIVSTKSQLVFKTAKLDFMTKLVDAVYPNYAQVIPTTPKEKITIDRADLIGSIDRISVFTAGTETPCMTLSFANNKLILTSADAEFGGAQDEMPIKYEGNKIDIRFNPPFIKDALNAIDDDEVDFLLTNGGSPAIIRIGGASHYTYVVMPLRV